MNNQKQASLSNTLVEALMGYNELEKQKYKLGQQQEELKTIILTELKEIFRDDMSIKVKVPGTEIEELDLTLRALNALRRKGFSTVEELVAKSSKSELSKIRGMGRVSLADIIDSLERKGFVLRP